MQLRHRRKRNLATHDWIIITVLEYSRERGGEQAITFGKRQQNYGSHGGFVVEQREKGGEEERKQAMVEREECSKT